MKLLEVVRFDPTSDETFESLVQYGKSVGKVTVGSFFSNLFILI